MGVGRPKKLSTVVAEGDRRATLKTLLKIVSEQIENCNSARDLPPLVRQLRELSAEIASLPSEESDPVAEAMKG